MTTLRKIELIVEVLLVVSLILVKVFLFLPDDGTSYFKIGWFVVLSFLSIPVIKLIFSIGRFFTENRYSEGWKEVMKSVNSALGIPLTIGLLILAIYALSKTMSSAALSALCVSWPIIGFSGYIAGKEMD